MAATTEVWDKFPPWVIRIENNENPKEFDPAEKICAIQDEGRISANPNLALR